MHIIGQDTPSSTDTHKPLPHTVSTVQVDVGGLEQDTGKSLVLA